MVILSYLLFATEHNIAKLGATAIPIGVIGNDPSGRTLLQILKESGFSTQGVIVDETRSTTVKTRVIAHNQQVVRIDKESKQGINRDIQKNILDIFFSQVQQAHAILIEGYNEGLLIKSLINENISYSRINGKILAVALAAGATVKETAALANFAAGIVCGEVGIVPIEKDKLKQSVLETRV